MEGIYKCPIFQGLTPEEINLLLNGKFHSKFYKTGETIAFQGDKYRSLLIVDKGIVRGEYPLVRFRAYRKTQNYFF